MHAEADSLISQSCDGCGATISLLHQSFLTNCIKSLHNDVRLFAALIVLNVDAQVALNRDEHAITKLTLPHDHFSFLENNCL